MAQQPVVQRLRAVPAQTVQQSAVTDPASDWWWDGQQWNCGCQSPQPPFCPPQGPPPWFPPPQGQPPWYPGANGGVSFSTSPPPNPIRGAFWWDGSVLWMFDGATWVAVGGTGSAPGTEPVLAVPTTSASTIATNTWTITPINGSPSLASGGTWNATTKQFTPNQPGIYGVQSQVWIPTAGFHQVAVLKNDSGGPYPSLQNVEICTIQELSAAGWMTSTGFTQINGINDFVRMWSYAFDGNIDQSYGFPSLRVWKMP